MPTTENDSQEFERAFKVRVRAPGKDGPIIALDRLYTIDYRGSRVGFHVQQARALALAHLINEETITWQRKLGECNNNLDQVSIAVVGGGIAGVTCFATLHALGFTGTHLFEAGPRLLNAQENSRHRYAHPSYNDWPLEDKFSATTQLPFLNWYGGRADEVIRQIRKDIAYKALHEKYGKGASGKTLIHCSTPIDFATFDDGKWNLSAKGNIQPSENPFDIVVYAAGFGEEVDLPASSSKSYWWSQENRFWT